MSFSNKIQNLVKVLDKLIFLEDDINVVIENIIKCYNNNGKVIVFGNGGSASDALHFCAELQGRFFLNRKSLNAVCLNANVSTMTAVSNDFGYNEIFRKPLEGMVCKNDVVIGISTSGNSQNVSIALDYAKKSNAYSVGLLGKDGGIIKDIAHKCLIMPSSQTPEIQEMHIMVIHYICQIVEEKLFNEKIKSN
ncbi:MAG: SIS domain-containing protein [Candidatus Muirbacterium halophilum]|nr:SIS domain-containing protein [Candidatus Muirbacterium halophilum]MCK9474846.1 SIS domain-containing protein [Candidatus Muirbacterium halophilum]